MVEEYFVTLAEAKKHCNIDFNDDDSYVTSLIGVAQDAVISHLCYDNATSLLTALTECPPAVRQAILLMVGNLYANREPVAFASASRLALSYDYLISLYRNYGG